MVAWIHLVVLVLLVVGVVTGYWYFFPVGIACELALWMYLWFLD